MRNETVTAMEERGLSASVPSFRQDLRRLLDQKGWSPRHASRMAGLSQDAVGHWLRGGLPLHKPLDAVAAALEAPPERVQAWHAEVAAARRARLADFRKWTPRPAPRRTCLKCEDPFLGEDGKETDLCPKCRRELALKKANVRRREAGEFASCEVCSEPIWMRSSERRARPMHKACMYWCRVEEGYNPNSRLAVQLRRCALKLGPKPGVVGSLKALADRSEISVKNLSRLLRAPSDYHLSEKLRAQLDYVVRELVGEALAWRGTTVEALRNAEIFPKGIRALKAMTPEEREEKIFSRTRGKRNPKVGEQLRKWHAQMRSRAEHGDPEALAFLDRSRKHGLQVLGPAGLRNKSLGRHLTAGELDVFAAKKAEQLGIPKEWILDLLRLRAGLPKPQGRPTKPDTIDWEEIIRRHTRRETVHWKSVWKAIAYVQGRELSQTEKESLRRAHLQRKRQRRKEP
jgi:transcriptional regulator with XRE-family HTH domain